MSDKRSETKIKKISPKAPSGPEAGVAPEIALASAEGILRILDELSTGGAERSR